MTFTEDLLRHGRRLIGTPYVKDGRDTSIGLDCTGLILEMFKASGVNLPDAPLKWYGKFERVSPEERASGDLVTLNVAQPGGKEPLFHLGILTDQRRLLHATNAKVGIAETRYPFPGMKVLEYYRYKHD